MITLGEGNTPLLQAPRLSERYGVDLWLKWEGQNPTGSFKDRGMAVAVSKALERGATRLVCASTGNTAASSAAYAARAGIEAVIVVVSGAAASSKLVQVRAVGATIVEVDGTFSDAYAEAERLASEEGSVFVNSAATTTASKVRRPRRSRSSSSSAACPTVLTLPYGGGGNTRAYARGFEEAAGALPRIHPVQAADRAPTRTRRPSASSIRCTAPRPRTIVARSGGSIITVSDDQIEAGVAADRARGGDLLRARVRGRRRGAAGGGEGPASASSASSPGTA